MEPDEAIITRLCLQCAICCNGVLFKDVELQAGDDPRPLRGAGLPVVTRQGRARFPQPCAALEGCRCRAYGVRPRRCREFVCHSLGQVVEGRLAPEAALRLIRTTLRKAATVRSLFQQLGNTQEAQPFCRRFKEIKRRVETGPLDDDAAALFGDLSLAVHELDMLLRTHFYPDPAD